MILKIELLMCFDHKVKSEPHLLLSPCYSLCWTSEANAHYALQCDEKRNFYAFLRTVSL